MTESFQHLLRALLPGCHPFEKALRGERHGPEYGVPPRQRLLRPLAPGDVAGGGVDRVLFHDRDGLPLQPDLRAVLAEITVLEVGGPHAPAKLLQSANGLHPIFGVDELDKPPGQQLLVGIAERLLESRIYALEVPVQARDAEQIRRELEQTIPLLLGQPAFPADFRLLEPSLHGGAQPGEVAFHNVVVGPGLHRLHRVFFPDLPGDEDEWGLRVRLAQQCQRLRRRKTRHVPIREDHVPRPPVRERPPHILRGVHPLVPGLEAALLQLAQQEKGVVLGVLHDQDAQGNAARSAGAVCSEVGLHRDSSLISPVETSPTCAAYRAAWVRLLTSSLR